MAYPITIVDGRPRLDSLPVGKIINYPLEKRDYRPFAQFRICINEEGLHLYLWAFEKEVSPKSVQRACLNLCPSQEKYLDFALFGDGSAHLSIREGDRAVEEQPAEIHPLCGEDLQGVYWGGQYLFPWGEIRRIFGREQFQQGDTVRGNLYKTCDDKAYFHQGCFFPVDFQSIDPYGERFFGEFVLTR